MTHAKKKECVVHESRNKPWKRRAYPWMTKAGKNIE
jgi:hypothetical protein